MQRSTVRGDRKCMVFLGVVMLLFFSFEVVSASYVERVVGSCASDSSQFYIDGEQTASYSIDFDYARGEDSDASSLFFNSIDLGYDTSITGGYLDGYYTLNGETSNPRNFPYTQDCSEGCLENATHDSSGGWFKGVYRGWNGFLDYGCIDPICNYHVNEFQEEVEKTAICRGNKVTYNYSGIYFSDHSSNEDTDCNADIYYTEVWNGSPPEEYNCVFPVIENLTIYPEYDSLKYTNRTNLTYEEFFPDNKLKPYINFTIIYSDESEPSDDEKFVVNYTINFTYPAKFPLDSSYTSTYKNSTTCSKDCMINIPENYIARAQDTLILVEAQVFKDGVASKKNSTERYTPFFDIVVNGIDAGNVLFGYDDLVENKPIATRVNLTIYSYLRKVDSSDLFMHYIDSIKNISVDFIVDGKKEMSSNEDLIYYGGIEELKQKVVNKSLSVNERRNAMLILQDIHKQAKDTRNFIGYIPKGKTGSINIKVEVVDAEDINEYKYGYGKSNNYFSKEYVLRVQKDPDFKILFTGLNMQVPGQGYQIEDYNKNILRMKETYKFIKSAFPFDPTKVSVTIRPSLAFVQVDDIDDDTFSYIQKQADASGYDLAFGVIPSGVGKLISPKKLFAGLYVPEDYSKAVIIIEDSYFGTYAHEAGHLFELYLDEEQKSGPPCPPEQYGIMDVGLLASDGACMDSETGKPCKAVGLFAPMGFNGVMISIWKDRGTHIGFYASNDAPIDYNLLPFDPKELVNLRKFDIMSLSNSVWMRKDPTYDKLKKRILVA